MIKEEDLEDDGGLSLIVLSGAEEPGEARGSYWARPCLNLKKNDFWEGGLYLLGSHVNKNCSAVTVDCASLLN